MIEQSFSAVVAAGHKELAVEVPFDPARVWGATAQPIRPGRRGVAVAGSVKDVPFVGHVVGRSGRHWLLLQADVVRAAGLGPGDAVSVCIHPCS